MNTDPTLSTLTRVWRVGLAVVLALAAVPVGPGAGVVRAANEDMAVTKSTTPDPATVGRALTYIITATNTNNGALNNIQISDTLPAGVLFSSATYTTTQGNSGTCNYISGTVTCSINSLSHPHYLWVRIVVTPTVAGSLSNTAVGTTSDTESNLSNNSASVTTTVNPSADLSVALSDSPDPILSGQELVYTAVVSNLGLSPSSGGSLTLSLPANITYGSATPGCSPSGSTVTCPVPGLSVSASATFTVAVSPTSAATGIITAVATVTGSEADNDATNNSDSESTTVNPIDLELVKTAWPAEVAVGDQVTYTLAVTNHGPVMATGVSLSDDLPAGVTFVSASAGCGEAGGTVTCSLNDLADEASQSIVVVVEADETGVVTNSASVTGDQPELNTADNSDSVNVDVIPLADLSITKSATAATAGQVLTYTLTVANAGPSTAANVVVTDTLPAGVTLLDTSVTCTGSSSLSCNLGALASGADTSVEVVVLVNASTRGSLLNRAGVSATTTDRDLNDNSTQISTPVSAVADLALSQSAGPSPVLANESLVYTLTVTNLGPSTATSVQVVDTLPANVSFSSASAGCSHTSGVVTCQLASLASGASHTFVITVVPGTAAIGTITNTASAAAAESDPALANNQASVTVDVLPPIPVTGVYRVFFPIIGQNAP